MIFPYSGESGSVPTTARKSGSSTPVPSCRQATYRYCSCGALIASSGVANIDALWLAESCDMGASFLSLSYSISAISAAAQAAPSVSTSR